MSGKSKAKAKISLAAATLAAIKKNIGLAVIRYGLRPRRRSPPHVAVILQRLCDDLLFFFRPHRSKGGKNILKARSLNLHHLQVSRAVRRDRA